MDSSSGASGASFRRTQRRAGLDKKFKTNSPVGEQDHKFIGKNEISISPRNSVFFAMEKITKLEQLSKTRIYLVVVAITEPNRRLNLTVA